MMLSKNKLFTTAKYHLEQSLFQTYIMLGVLALNVVIAIIIKFAVGGDAMGGSSDIIVHIWGIIMGLYMFGAGFKIAIENGTSRKTYFFAVMIAFVITAFVWAVVAIIFTAISTVVNSSNLYLIIYAKISLGTFIWQFSMLFFIMMLGLLIRCIMRRCSRKAKLITMFTLIIAILSIVLANVLANGVVFQAIGEFLSAGLGLKSNSIAAPYIGSLFLLGLGLIETLVFYLLVMRAEIV